MKQMHLKNQRFVWNANKHFALIDKHVDLHKRMLISIVYTYFKVKALGFLVYIRELQLASKMHIKDANIQWQPS